MENLDRILASFKDKKILVVGDLALDTYAEGEIEGISPEAPVHVVSVHNQHYEPGVAGNVASNIASLGGKACIFSFIWEDAEGEILKKLLDERGIEYFLGTDSMTTNKTRVTARGQQLMRLDRGKSNRKNFSSEINAQLLRKAEESHLIVISDDANGTITPNLMELLIPYRKKMIIDPKPINKSLYREAYLIVPNQGEALTMSGCSDIPEAAEKLREELGSNLLITRGGRLTYLLPIIL